MASLWAIELDLLGHFSQKEIPTTGRSGGELGLKFSLNFRDVLIRPIPSPDAAFGAGVPSFSPGPKNGHDSYFINPSHS